MGKTIVKKTFEGIAGLGILFSFLIFSCGGPSIQSVSPTSKPTDGTDPSKDNTKNDDATRPPVNNPVTNPPPTGSTPQKLREWKTACGSINEVVGASYCVHDNSDLPEKTIWFFHGLGDSPMVFNQSGAPYSSYVDLKKMLGPVKIVAISFGTSWLLTSYGPRTLEPVASTTENFLNTIKPLLENKFNLPRPHSIVGHSMGGFNVSSLCSLRPELWDKCVLLNAMLPTCDPFGWVQLCNPGPGLVVKYNFTADTWLTSSPLALLKKTGRLPKSFVTACYNDDWGLFTGPKEWSDTANSKGFNSKWLPIMTNCDHAHWPALEVSAFLND